jgi:hypothetical protein
MSEAADGIIPSQSESGKDEENTTSTSGQHDVSRSSLVSIPSWSYFCMADDLHDIQDMLVLPVNLKPSSHLSALYDMVFISSQRRLEITRHVYLLR